MYSGNSRMCTGDQAGKMSANGLKDRPSFTLSFLTSQAGISGCEHTEDSVLPVHLLLPGTLAHHVVTPIPAFLEEQAWTSTALHNPRCTCVKWDIYTPSTYN